MNEEILIPITLFISAALMIVAVAYYKSRENLSMIERGMNPREHAAKPAPYRSYKWGLLLIGLGTGLAVAYLLDRALLKNDDTDAIYFALMSVGAGMGLVVAHKAEKEWLDRQEAKEQHAAR